MRANRQLAVELQAQGLDEEAAHFTYRAHVLQRHVLWRQRHWGAWLFSLFLAGLAGYGYKLWRGLLAYVLTNALFMDLYLLPEYTRLSPVVIPYRWDQAVVVSIHSFHGRGFFYGPSGHPASRLLPAGVGPRGNRRAGH